MKIFSILCLALLASLSGCSWSKDDVAATDDQGTLKRIYSEAEDRDVRRAALVKIEDQDFLLTIAERTDRESDSEFNRLVIANLSSQPHLATFVREGLAAGRLGPGLEAAIAQMQDQTLLADIVLSSQDERALFVMERMSDSRALEAVFSRHDDYEISEAAFNQITDQQIIVDIVLNRTSLWPANAGHILATIKDPDLIARLVIEPRGDLSKNSSIRDLRSQLLEKLSDQHLLARVAMASLGYRLSEPAAERLTDPNLLAAVSLGSDDPSVRLIAIEKITDPAVMIEIAAKDPDNGFLARKKFFAMKAEDEDALVTKWLSWFREDLTAELADQSLLEQIALSAADADVRLAAIRNLSRDSIALVTIAKNDTYSRNRAFAVDKISDQEALAFLAENDGYQGVRMAAVRRLTDQELLKTVFLQKGLIESRNPNFYREKYENVEVRRIALDAISDETFLARVVADAEVPIEFRLSVARRTDDQTFLEKTAQDERAAIRQVAVYGISDDGFLLDIFSAESSPAVRVAIIDAINNPSSVRDVALKAYNATDRAHAARRLRDAFGDPAGDIAAAHRALEQQAEALKAEPDQDRLVTIASGGEFDILVTAAAIGLFDPFATERAASEARDREALKILLKKLFAPAQLERISQTAVDPAMRVAAAKKSGLKSWSDIFTEASAQSASVEMLGDALAAVSLFDELQSDARTEVQEAALSLIRNGDETRIPEMADLLEDYGDKRLAEDYLNAGQPDLSSVASSWAGRRGLSVHVGSGSSRAKWGSQSP